MEVLGGFPWLMEEVDQQQKKKKSIQETSQETNNR